MNDKGNIKQINFQKKQETEFEQPSKKFILMRILQLKILLNAKFQKWSF